jgi:trimethylguanosine synthase
MRTALSTSRNLTFGRRRRGKPNPSRRNIQNPNGYKITMLLDWSRTTPTRPKSPNISRNVRLASPCLNILADPRRPDFAQRTRFLSLYSSPPGCLLDEEGWYSITPELVADRIAERCRCDTILDAFCGVGGNAIAFAKTCERGTSIPPGLPSLVETSPVIALDISPTRLALARHNAQIYGVADRIEFVLSDYISFANAYLSVGSGTSPRKIDVVFLSPPWGGPSYISGDTRPSSPVKPAAEQPPVHPTYTLASIQPVHGAELFHLSRRITRNIAYYLPRNTQLEEISDLLADPSESGVDAGDKREMVEVEEEWMGSKLKALTCYFGGLADGQPELFDA